jgi:glutaredoxin 3
LTRAEVLLFSTPTCPVSARLKEILAAKGVAFRDLDVSADRDALVLLLRYAGQATVPTLVAYGEVMVGFDALRLEQLLEGLAERAESYIRRTEEEDAQIRDSQSLVEPSDEPPRDPSDS